MCTLCLSECCFVACMMYCACVHIESNITRLTKPFFSTDRRAHTRSQTHTRTHTHSLTQADMCSAQPVITPALMWSLGGTEASYYCRFYDNFHSLALHSPSLPPSLPRLVYPASLSPPLLSIPSLLPLSPTSSKPTSISLAVAMGRLFVFSV